MESRFADVVVVERVNGVKQFAIRCDADSAAERALHLMREARCAGTPYSKVGRTESVVLTVGNRTMRIGGPNLSFVRRLLCV